MVKFLKSLLFILALPFLLVALLIFILLAPKTKD